MEKKTDTPKMGETSETIRKDLNRIGMLVKEFRRIESTLLPTIKILCVKAIEYESPKDNPDINVDVYFNEDDGILNSEGFLEICIKLSINSANSTCIFLDSLNEIDKMMGNTIPRVEAKSSFLLLYFNCQELASAFGCNMNNWSNEL